MKNTFIIAEAGVNHNGSLDTALMLVDVAARAGADAVKFQTFSADEIATRSVARADYQEHNSKASSQHEMLRQLELSPEAHCVIAARCADLGIEFMSTAFCPATLAFLIQRTGIQRIKIPSGEIVNPLLLVAAGRSGLPVIMSTGMADLGEITEALQLLCFGGLSVADKPTKETLVRAMASPEGRSWLSAKVTLLHCTTAYPAPPNTINLRVMGPLSNRYAVPVGFLEHSEGIEIVGAAAALGAVVIEKHFTLGRGMEGPDHRASLEPDELAQMVANIRNIDIALGNAEKKPDREELKMRAVARRVLVAARDIEAGEILDEGAIAVKRAGEGISAMQYWSWIGRKAGRSYRRDECLIS